VSPLRRELARCNLWSRTPSTSSVRLSGESAQTAREVRGGRKAAEAAGRTWCFDMSSAAHLNDGFVVVRRVHTV
jgi:hypothetical protein